tara:strand:+ start:196 stop:543 length:348 start_codon:yes stop_codon:yes gene_type:complete
MTGSGAYASVASVGAPSDAWRGVCVTLIPRNAALAHAVVEELRGAGLCDTARHSVRTTHLGGGNAYADCSTIEVPLPDGKDYGDAYDALVRSPLAGCVYFEQQVYKRRPVSGGNA